MWSYRYDLPFFVVFSIIILANLIYVSYIDVKTQTITNKSNLIILVLSIILPLIIAAKYKTFSPITDSLLGLAVGFVPFSLIAIFTNGSIGGGDIKLFGALGVFLGLSGIIICIAMTFVFAGVFAIIMIGLKKMDKKSYLPLAPFITLAFFVHMILNVGGIL